MKVYLLQLETLAIVCVEETTPKINHLFYFARRFYEVDLKLDIDFKVGSSLTRPYENFNYIQKLTLK